MATYYVDNVGGSDSNNGLSTATAFASMDKFQSLAALTNGDIIYVKYTGTDYTISQPASTYYFYNGTTSIVVIIKGYSTNTSRPNFNITITSGCYFGSIYISDINMNITSSLLGSVPRIGEYQSTSYTNGTIKNSIITYYFSGTLNNASVHSAIFGMSIFINVDFIGPSNQSSCIAFLAGSNVQIIKCKFKNWFHGTGSASNYLIGSSSALTLDKCIFYDIGSSRTNFSVTQSGSLITIKNCVFILGTTYAKATGFCILPNNSATKAYSNILYNNSGSTVTLSAITYSPTAQTNGIFYGNNALYNITYTSYNTLTDPTGIMPFGIDRAITTNPFLSIDPTSDDFCKIDTTNTDAINAIIGKAFYDSNIDLGVYQTVSSGGGATPNAYDLRAGVTVGSVTGTLVIPAVSDVRSGVSYDVAPNAKTGTLDLPSIADVKLGVVYDNTTKTGTLESTDPGIANVLSGVNYKINSVLKTGSYNMPVYTDPGVQNVQVGTDYVFNDVLQSGTCYVPNASDVRSGVNVNQTTGTLDLPSINDVRSGTVYDNTTKTGLLDLPSISDVKNGVSFDQATKTGTYDPITGNYTDVGVGNVLLGATYKFAGTTKTGTLESTDPGVANVVAGTTYKINSTLYTGTRTAIYSLLPVNLVKIGQDRGDGTTGTYDGSDRYTDLDLSNVKSSYSFRYNSLTNNRTGTHNESISTDPGVANVRSGTNYTINDVVKTGTLDLPSEDKVDLGTTFDNNTKIGTMETTDPGIANVLSGVTYKIKSVSKTGTKPFYALLDPTNVKYGIDRGDGTLGTDVGADFNDNLLEDKVQLGFAYKNLNVNKTGTLAGGAADYPSEDKVLYPNTYAYGTKTGTLGKYIDTNLDIANQIKSNAYAIISSVLGAEYKDLKYFKEIEKNDFYSNTKTFGIRCLDDVMTKEVIGQETIDLKYEIKITNDFQNRDGDDLERAVEQELITKMEAIRRQLRITKMGNFNNIRIVKDFNRAETEKVGDNVIVCRAVITVSYSVK